MSTEVYCGNSFLHSPKISLIWRKQMKEELKWNIIEKK
jgi:hypothetical protein